MAVTKPTNSQDRTMDNTCNLSLNMDMVRIWDRHGTAEFIHEQLLWAATGNVSDLTARVRRVYDANEYRVHESRSFSTESSTV